jgi:hypothetical protein
MWVEFTEPEFAIWHESIKTKLGYPITPVNAETGLPDETAQKVESYTELIAVGDKFIAWVDETESEGLQESELSPIVRSKEEM